MPRTILNNLDNILVKSMDFLKIFSCFTEDVKIEELCKDGISTKSLQEYIFYGLVVYDPLRFAGLNNLQHKSVDFKWN